MQVHVDNGKLGYLAARSHDLVPLTGRLSGGVAASLNQALAAMRERLSDPRFPRFVRSLELFTNETDVQVNVVESDRPVMKRFFEWCESTAALDYSDGAGNLPRKSEIVLSSEPVPGGEAGGDRAGRLDSGGTGLDLYAGVGLFALPWPGISLR